MSLRDSNEGRQTRHWSGVLYRWEVAGYAMDKILAIAHSMTSMRRPLDGIFSFAAKKKGLWFTGPLSVAVVSKALLRLKRLIGYAGKELLRRPHRHQAHHLGRQMWREHRKINDVPNHNKRGN